MMSPTLLLIDTAMLDDAPNRCKSLKHDAVFVILTAAAISVGAL